MQAYARRWLSQKKVDCLRRERARRLAWLDMQERRRNEEKEEQLRNRRQRWTNPQRREDFNLLYHALESRLGRDTVWVEVSLCGTGVGAHQQNVVCCRVEV